jgi:hypothetical protein
MFTNRIKELENQLNKRLNEYTENERKLRREIELLTNKNSELETKLVEATSTVSIYFFKKRKHARIFRRAFGRQSHVSLNQETPREGVDDI